MALSDRPEDAPPAGLFALARGAARHAWAPYSGFAVGAAVQLADGRTFAAANMENASYGLTVCAEVGALQAASSAGALAQVRRIAIVGGPIVRVPGHLPKATAPCGRCRQLIAEAALAGGHDVEVWFADLEGQVVERRTISQLLPDAFDAGHLSQPAR